MQKKIKKAAVLGSGVMGSAIAAHFANAGIPSLLLDLPDSKGEDPDAISKAGLKSALSSKPASFYVKDLASLIETGNFDRDMEKLEDCDLILEVIVERMEVKKSFFKNIDDVRMPGCIVASNTSGLSVNEMVKDCSEDMRKHFLGMHFFNPPRYLKLLELIPTKDTSSEVLDTMRDFGENVLGKGIVVCKDTPNFIANRIGMFSIMYAIKVMLEDGYTIQEIDAFTGANIGHPKSATFRTADLVGLDTMLHVADNLYENCTADEARDIFKAPEFLVQLVKNGILGAKTKKGFYHKSPEGEIKHLDPKTGDYLPKEKLNFVSIAEAMQEEGAAAKISAMATGKDSAAEFTWKLFSAIFLYAANRLGEISDTLVDIDNATKWGFGWELGPFETWDLLGVERIADKMKAEGKSLPANIVGFLEAGNKTFYKKESGKVHFYDFKAGQYQPVAQNAKEIRLADFKEQKKVIKSNAGASLIDLGEGVACLEFHTKMNAISSQTISMALAAVEEVDKNFRGLVVANQGEHFSAGANLMLILTAIMEEEWEEIDVIIRRFQKMNMAFRYSQKPVVAAPFGMTLAGGCEVAIHADQIMASAETYMGLVEPAVGLIPAGCGTKEMLLRSMANVPPDADPLPFLKKTFETIAMAKVATSAEEARDFGFLRPSDKIIINRDHQIHYSKRAVIGLADAGYRPPREQNNIPVTGRPGMAAVKLLVGIMKQGNFISEHDETVALKIGNVLTGGDLSGPQTVSERYLLNLEREAFLSLCGMRKTQERIKHMLTKGKPLRN